jgi:O-antigen/teichoic acid export membrane protein
LTGSLRLGSLSVIDQALLSLLNFLLVLALVYGASKEEYGLYAQTFALVLLLAGVQNALVLAPFITIASPLGIKERTRLWLRLAVLQGWVFGAMVSIGAVLFFTIPTTYREHSSLLYAGLVVATLGSYAREFMRVNLLSSLKTYDAFAQTSAYAAILSVAVMLLWIVGWLDAGAVLVVTGMAAVASLFVRRSLAESMAEEWPQRSASPQLDKFWEHGRFALAITVVSWVATNSYAFTAAYLGGGVGAAAEVSAARMIGVPIAILMSAWAGQFRPRAATWATQKQWAPLASAMRWSLVTLCCLVALYLFCVFAIGYLTNWAFLPVGYTNLGDYALLWLIYFVLAAVCTTFTCALQSAGLFSTILWISAFGAAANVLTLFAGAHQLAASAPIVGLIVGESLAGVLLISFGLGRLRRQVQSMSTNRI